MHPAAPSGSGEQQDQPQPTSCWGDKCQEEAGQERQAQAGRAPLRRGCLNLM